MIDLKDIESNLAQFQKELADMGAKEFTTFWAEFQKKVSSPLLPMMEKIVEMVYVEAFTIGGETALTNMIAAIERQRQQPGGFKAELTALLLAHLAFAAYPRVLNEGPEAQAKVVETMQASPIHSAIAKQCITRVFALIEGVSAEEVTVVH